MYQTFISNVLVGVYAFFLSYRVLGQHFNYEFQDISDALWSCGLFSGAAARGGWEVKAKESIPAGRPPPTVFL